LKTTQIFFLPEIILQKVLHYKTNFLNPSETFIVRLVQNHVRYKPVALCYRERAFTEKLELYAVPKNGLESWINTAVFHANMSLPFYDKTLKNIQPAIIHAHFGYDAYKLTGLANKHKIPLITSFYGSDVSRLPSEFGWKRRYKKLAALGDHFIAATDFMKSQLTALGFPRNHISVVRFGLDLKKFKYHENSPAPQKIMMVGRMVEKKGFKYAIEALSNLCKIGMNPELNIYGYGPLEQSLKKYSEQLGISHSVHFHGYQPIEKIMEALNQHNIMLVPSTTASDGDMEGLPNTILEAMAKGTVVVASKHAAIPEAVIDQETGFLFDEKDIDGLTETLKLIIEGEYNLNNIRRNALALVEKQYSVTRMVEEVENIYDTIMA